VGKRNKYLPLEKWVDVWLRVSQDYEQVRILITGGEPFNYPSFIDLVKELSQHCSIGFDTNLSCSKEELADFVKNTDASNISMGLSYHPMFSNFDTFLEKALFLKENGFANICVQFVTYPPQLDRLVIVREKFTENNLYFIPLPFRGKHNGREYPGAHTEEERRIIYNSTQDLSSEHKERVKNYLEQVVSHGRLCAAGQVYARVDSDGTVYRCGRYATNPTNSPMGNLFDGNFRLSEVPLLCEQEVCPCEFRWIVQN
jgi:MoaA/NifB/PqqE/SkfB family radical SAM enzyme